MPHPLTRMQLSSVELFCLVAEYQSFSMAARQAGLTAAAVSRGIARLESRLGLKLLTRTTRSVSLTEAGQLYFTECQQALTLLLEAEKKITGYQQAVSGSIRISVPTSYGHYRLLPLLPTFQQLYPDIQLDVQLTNKNVDFIQEGFDLAIRGRTPPDSGLIARQLEDCPLVIVATPAYLRLHGTPQQPEDLQRHTCIQFVLPSTGRTVPWLLQQHGQLNEYLTKGNIRCLEDILGCITLVKHDAGLLQTYRFLVEEDIQEGRLKEVLQDYAGASRPFSLLYPANRHLPQRLRIFIDFLLTKLRSNVYNPTSST